MPTKSFVFYLITVLLLITGCSSQAKVIKVGWVSGYETCPTHKEFGILVVNSVHLYHSSNVSPADIIEKIPHAAKVEVIQESSQNGTVKVRYEGTIGYIQDLFLVDYDPTGPVQPDESQCF